MTLLARILGLRRKVITNAAWLQRQDDRLERLERDLKAMQNEVSGLTGYERHQHGPPTR